jgi:hypothetical protein
MAGMELSDGWAPTAGWHGNIIASIRLING